MRSQCFVFSIEKSSHKMVYKNKKTYNSYSHQKYKEKFISYHYFPQDQLLTEQDVVFTPVLEAEYPGPIETFPPLITPD